MGIIKILPELVANKIAAGEVVERPASVVKELMENAIDAGAKTIAVSVGHGGKGFIRVKDDGCGMDREDAQACLVRHATSKITSAEDIQHIGTLGFRGEALPSIAAVSRLTMTTRMAAAQTATVVKSSGGTVESITEAVAEPGTLIEVSDLFFNTPARKKFLKSDVSEYNAIADIFDTLALSRSSLAFSLARNNMNAATYPACENLLERIGQVYSSEAADSLYPVAFETPDLKLSGYIGTPDNCRVNRTGQKFFINSRPVQSIALSAALSRAYEEFLERGRFPVAVLFLEIEESCVDVNVHPAKREVRLRNERFLLDSFVHTIKKELHRKGFFIQQPFPSENTAPRDIFYREPSARGPSFQTLKEQSAAWSTSQQQSFFENDYKSAAGPGPQPAGMPAPQPGAAEQPGNPFKDITILGQVMGTYIIAQLKDGFAVFDQHAAHERILYESLLASALQREAVSQTLIFPVTLHLTLQEAELMEKHLQDFQKMGFGINPLAGKSFSIDAVPACMAGIDAQAVLRDCLHELMEGSGMRSFKNHQEALAAILACKTYTVKAGRQLDLQEMQHLITTLGTQENPHVCPHGRPTFFTITRDELERRFKRT